MIPAVAIKKIDALFDDVGSTAAIEKSTGIVAAAGAKTCISSDLKVVLIFFIKAIKQNYGCLGNIY